jgi:hypothetical protein
MSCRYELDGNRRGGGGWPQGLRHAATAVAAVAVWAVFHPGLMSVDSIGQYKQAVTGIFNDWHPPLMAVLLRAVLSLGGGLGLIMLAQCLAGAFGVRAFAETSMVRLFGDRLSRGRAAWLSLLALLILLVPPSPLPFYLMTFWKDAWAMVLLLWVGAVALRMFPAGEPILSTGGPARRPSLLAFSGLLLLAAAYGQIRHNAVVSLPFLGLYLGVELRRRRVHRAVALAAAVAPLAASLALGVSLDLAFGVKETRPSSQVMAFELVGMCAENEAACRGFPLIQRHLRAGDYRERYRPGDLGSIFWEPPVVLDPAIMMAPLHEELSAEYRKAALEHPLDLAEVKAESFWSLLGTEQTAYFFHDTVVENPFGLTLNGRFEALREPWIAFTRRAVAGGALRWVVGVHLVWLAANLLWIAGLALRSRRSPAGWRLLSLALFLTVPLAYYLSYLLAATVLDFRFLFPATLMAQCLTLAGLLGMLGAGAAAGIGPPRQNPNGRAP